MAASISPNTPSVISRRSSRRASSSTAATAPADSTAERLSRRLVGLKVPPNQNKKKLLGAFSPEPRLAEPPQRRRNFRSVSSPASRHPERTTSQTSLLLFSSLWKLYLQRTSRNISALFKEFHFYYISREKHNFIVYKDPTLYDHVPSFLHQ